MAYDTRSLSFKPKDDAQRWRVFQAVEDTALHVAAQRGIKTFVWTRVTHASGSFGRSDTAQARTTVERNGFDVQSMRLEIESVDADGDGDPWVQADFVPLIPPELRVSVQGRSEVEVNGVFAMLERAVEQAKRAPSPSTTAMPAVPSSGFARMLNHAYSVQIIGGVIAALMVAGILGLWALWG